MSTILSDMTTSTHVPVLAGELIDLLDPRPGQTAIDCTFGGGGHAQLIAERLGPEGTLIAIDRDPLARERFQELASEVACTVRFIRASYAQALEDLADEGVRADVVYFDLGMSSMQVDARERGFSYSYDAPLDMRMDPDQEYGASELIADLGRASPGADAARLWRGAPLRRDRPRDRAPARAEPRSITTQELVETIVSAIPAPARFAGGHPAKRSFQALRIAVNDELEQLEEALPLAWGLLREGGVLAGISFQSLEDRRVKRFLAERAQGCVCPPDLPVCACGREPEAALLTRRSIVPSAGEIASNPRSSSARLRAARKLNEEAA